MLLIIHYRNKTETYRNVIWIQFNLLHDELIFKQANKKTKVKNYLKIEVIR